MYLCFFFFLFGRLRLKLCGFQLACEFGHIVFASIFSSLLLALSGLTDAEQTGACPHKGAGAESAL